MSDLFDLAAASPALALTRWRRDAADGSFELIAGGFLVLRDVARRDDAPGAPPKALVRGYVYWRHFFLPDGSEVPEVHAGEMMGLQLQQRPATPMSFAVVAVGGDLPPSEMSVRDVLASDELVLEVAPRVSTGAGA